MFSPSPCVLSLAWRGRSLSRYLNRHEIIHTSHRTVAAVQGRAFHTFPLAQEYKQQNFRTSIRNGQMYSRAYILNFNTHLAGHTPWILPSSVIMHSLFSTEEARD